MENKIARICWNSNDWLSPSGSDGKSHDKNSFENMTGYGHEEWLSDDKKLIDGFKYSFLQPINTPKKSHQGKEYSIWLYTIKDKEKLCVGKIKHVYCLTEDEAIRAAKIYKDKNWFQEMIDQLEDLDVDTSNFIEKNTLDNFNIRFKPEDIVWFEEPQCITDEYNCSRYNLLNKTELELDVASVNDSDELIDDLKDIENSDLSDSEKDTLTKARVGQGKFKRDVINIWQGEQCAITLVNIKEMLIASHIKAWKDCESTNERLDGANGILLCAHVDKLFDNHLITFTCSRARYYLEISKSLDISQLKGLGIEKGIELEVSHLEFEASGRFKKYMEYHNQLFASKESSRV